MSGQEMDVEAIEQEEISDEAEEEVVMEDVDYAMLKNKFVKPKKRVAGETRPELSSEEELKAKYTTVRRRKRPKKLIIDDVKQSSDRDQVVNTSRNHNQAKERTEQGSIQLAESEAQNLGNESTNNGKEDVGEGFKSNRNGKFSDLRFKMYEKGPFNIHPFSGRKKGKEVGTI
jgi:hypothetical protein